MNPHYFSDTDEARANERTPLEYRVRGIDFHVEVADQVFSSHRLDLGTKVLIDCAPPPPERGTFVDVGCGWGAISLALAHLSPEATVWAVDPNTRARDLTKRNARALGYRSVEVMSPENAKARAEALVAAGGGVDLVWSNPPVRIGKAALRELLTSWLGVLAPEGEAWFVIAKNLGADSMTAWLCEQGWDAVKIQSKKGYRIIRVRRA